MRAIPPDSLVCAESDPMMKPLFPVNRNRSSRLGRLLSGLFLIPLVGLHAAEEPLSAKAKTTSPSSEKPAASPRETITSAKPPLATRDDEAMRRWRANRFGLFVHWGLYAVAGGEWNGKEIGGAAEWLQASGKVSAAEYATLAGQFNPT